MRLEQCPTCGGKGFLSPNDLCTECEGAGADFSLMCKCGHPAADHHLVWWRGFQVFADECEVYGFNETGGMQYVDGKWVDHCHSFEPMLVGPDGTAPL